MKMKKKKTTKKKTIEFPKNESGLILMIRIGKSIRHKWVNRLTGKCKSRDISAL